MAKTVNITTLQHLLLLLLLHGDDIADAGRGGAEGEGEEDVLITVMIVNWKKKTRTFLFMEEGKVGSEGRKKKKKELLLPRKRAAG
mmetsp:Transcript_25030/g.59498  ORF Transcript_25030/g.59498 Transcript_25030/m.59498 type:complete len:86 (-) Transcript_25030:355-612(-)